MLRPTCVNAWLSGPLFILNFGFDDI